jgi:hypothetical protein
MVHLSVAHSLVQDHGYSDSPAFYLGSIAPDAIHMRPGTEQKDKHVVHFVDQTGLQRERLHALLAQGQQAEPRAFVADEFVADEFVADDFVAGYAAHVLTDVAWRAEIILPFRRPRVEHMPYSELRTLYYNECDKLDFDLYDEQPWRPAVWEMLSVAEARDIGLEGDPPLLSADEIDAWRNRILGWFDAHRVKASYQPQYITRELVWPFIPQTAAQIAAQLAELG